MDKQVKDLLDEERKVNSLVKQALQMKREKLATVQAATERAVAKEKHELEVELKEKIAQVSSRRVRQSSRCSSVYLPRAEKSHDGAGDVAHGRH